MRLSAEGGAPPRAALRAPAPAATPSAPTAPAPAAPLPAAPPRLPPSVVTPCRLRPHHRHLQAVATSSVRLGTPRPSGRGPGGDGENIVTLQQDAGRGTMRGNTVSRSPLSSLAPSSMTTPLLRHLIPSRTRAKDASTSSA